MLGHCETLDTSTASCTAGQLFQFRFRARDLFGNAVAAVASAFSISATTEDDQMQGRCADAHAGLRLRNLVLSKEVHTFLSLSNSEGVDGSHIQPVALLLAAGDLVSEGEGVYASRFLFKRSGEYSINLEISGEVRSFSGICYAGALDLNKSDQFCWDETLKAGETGWLTFKPRDR